MPLSNSEGRGGIFSFFWVSLRQTHHMGSQVFLFVCLFVGVLGVDRGSGIHFLGGTTELHRFFLGSQQNRELRGAERITLDTELICINSSQNHAVDAQIIWKQNHEYQVML